jgi:Cu/Ag efflux protein CusF
MLLTLLLSSGLLLAACDRSQATRPPANNAAPANNRATSVATPAKVTGPAAAVATTHFEGVGKVISINPKRPSIELDHEEIKDLMPAMTMEFFVKDKSLLDGLQTGDQVTFSLDNGVGGIVITKISKK